MSHSVMRNVTSWSYVSIILFYILYVKFRAIFASMIWAKAKVIVFKGYLPCIALLIYGTFFLWSDVDVRCIKWPNVLLHKDDQSEK